MPFLEVYLRSFWPKDSNCQEAKLPNIKSEYESIRALSNGHLQTILPFFFRTDLAHTPPSNRIVEDTPDGDFLETYYYEKENADSCVIITHGLEGNATNPYMTSLATVFFEHGMSAVTWNMRCCGDEINKTEKFYHALDTSDLELLINKYAKHYQNIYLVGFSLGGAITTNYLTRKEVKTNQKVKKACLISTPFELNQTSKKLESISNRLFYQKVFTKTMKQKILAKHEVIPLPIDIDRIKKAKFLSEFDDHLVAPIYGFEDGFDYRRQASPLPHLENLETPLYVINSLDDPFLTKHSYPFDFAEQSKYFHLETPKTGGHVGFIRRSFEEYYWYDMRVLDFIQGKF